MVIDAGIEGILNEKETGICSIFKHYALHMYIIDDDHAKLGDGFMNISEYTGAIAKNYLELTGKAASAISIADYLQLRAAAASEITNGIADDARMSNASTPNHTEGNTDNVAQSTSTYMPKKVTTIAANAPKGKEQETTEEDSSEAEDIVNILNMLPD